MPSIHIPPNTSPQAHQLAKKTQYLTLGPQTGKPNSDTQQIGDVKKIQKELFQFDDIDDDILANAASEAESTLSSVK